MTLSPTSTEVTGENADTAGGAAAAPPARRPRLLVTTGPHGPRLSGPAAVLAIAAGLGLWLSFPPYNLWPLAPLSVTALAVAAHRRRARAGFGLGVLTGLALFVPLLDWTGTQVGSWPWLLLAASQAVFIGALGALASYATPLYDRHRWTWPVVTAALWVLEEAMRDRFPFGGFPWGRLAFSQADSPLLAFAWLGGAPLVTFTTALAGAFLLPVLWRGPAATRSVRRAAAWTAAAALTVTAGLAVPTTAPDQGQAVVAVIQGNVPRIGLDFNSQRREVLDNHAEQTRILAGRVAAGEVPRPDLVIWPENSSDIDPTRNSDAANVIAGAVQAIGAPILVGALVKGEDGRSRNAGLIAELNPDGTLNLTVAYVKRNLVPFVENVPMRDLVSKITSKVNIAGNFAPGTEPGIVHMGGVAVGDVICYEIAFDDIVHDTVALGAQLIAVQTNNATFDNNEAWQQMSMVRLRAVEYGRSALMSSTVGVSGFVDADGTVHDATAFNTPAALIRTLDLGDGVTPAQQLGMLPELLLAIGAAVAVSAAAVLHRRRRQAAQA